MMKALTVWQPWATLIAIGAKPYEFRGWMPPTDFVWKRIAIHAAARPVRLKEVEDILTRLENGDKSDCLIADKAAPLLIRVRAGILAKKRKNELFTTEPEQEPFELPHSAVVCTAILGFARPGKACAMEFGCKVEDHVRGFNYGWPMNEVVPMMPVPARGAQGFWEWEDVREAAHRGCA